MATKRKTRAQWKRLITEWRRSGRTAEEFAAERGVVTATMRWWAWALAERAAACGGPPSGPVADAISMVPVRVVDLDEEPPAVIDTEVVAWSLRTPRGELRVYATSQQADELRAAITMLLGSEP